MRIQQHDKVSHVQKEVARIEEVSWQMVRDDFASTNPTVADAIDSIKPSKKLSFIRAHYPFGVDILQRGVAFFPTNEGTIVPAGHPMLPKAIQSKLDNTFLGIVLNKSVEVYVDSMEGRTIPFKLFKPGTAFGVWEIMETPEIMLRQSHPWSISSGARTLFMLPHITDNQRLKKLAAAYDVKSYAPSTIFEQHAIFKEIAHHNAPIDHWHTDILFFTKDWLVPQKNLGWMRLKQYWLEEAWRQMHQWSMRGLVLNLNWEFFLAEIARRKLTLKPYLIDTLQHLLSIGCGTIPGFRPVDASQLVAPTAIIESAYQDVYGLKQYPPTLMYPDLMSPASDINALYYSLTHPTLPQKPPKSNYFPSVMKLLHELKALMDMYLELADTWPSSQTTHSFDFLDTIQLDYFHNGVDKQRIIRAASHIPEEDVAFQTMLARFPDTHFPTNSHFLSGCVKLSVH